MYRNSSRNFNYNNAQISVANDPKTLNKTTYIENKLENCLDSFECKKAAEKNTLAMGL